MAAIRRMAAFKALAQALIGARRPGAPTVRERLGALPRMLRLGLTGRYPLLDRSRMVLVGLGILYVISPVDLIPEAILPLIGLGDDALVFAWLAGAVLAETDAFLAWEKSRPRVVVV